MIFKGIENESVEMKVLGYQFPHVDKPDDYDANWLRIYTKVVSNKGNWQTVDSSLLTWDVERLSEWFKKLSIDNSEEKNIDFLEPNLAFQLIEVESEIKKIRLIFELESRPMNASSDVSYFVDFLFDNEQLLTLSKELEEYLNRYPKR